jgi:hypothetical protein
MNLFERVWLLELWNEDEDEEGYGEKEIGRCRGRRIEVKRERTLIFFQSTILCHIHIRFDDLTLATSASPTPPDHLCHEDFRYKEPVKLFVGQTLR